VPAGPPSLSAVRVRILHDHAMLWPQAVAILRSAITIDDDISGESSDERIGVVTWARATRDEISEIPPLRENHHGPIVSILAELPFPRGARAVATNLEGSVLAAEMQRSLLPTLWAVAAGQCVVPRLIRQLVDRPQLSPRERQILAMVVLDFSNAEIARKLVVTESNVKSHLTSAFNKLGVTSRSAAAALILDGESGLGAGILRISPEE
jgi:DNA-binding NarL/FixJ family response regulator